MPLIVVLMAAVTYSVVAIGGQMFAAAGDGPALFLACCSVVGLQYIAKQAPSLSGRWASLQLPRRVQHATSGLLIAILYVKLPWRLAVGGLGAGFVAFALLQCLRQLSPIVNKEFLSAFGDILKEEEREGAPPAALSFLLGSLLCALCFPWRVCLVSILGAALGDPAAAIVGELAGGPKIAGKKTLGGFLGCFAASGTCGLAVAMHGIGAADADIIGQASALVSAFLLCGTATAVPELATGLRNGMEDNVAVLFGAGILLSVFHRLEVGNPALLELFFVSDAAAA